MTTDTNNTISFGSCPTCKGPVQFIATTDGVETRNVDLRGVDEPRLEIELEKALKIAEEEGRKLALRLAAAQKDNELLGKRMEWEADRAAKLDVEKDDLRHKTESLWQEVVVTRNRFEKTISLLSGIHALLYPPLFVDADGKTWKFNSPEVHNLIQALSDRVRALPEEISELRIEAQQAPPVGWVRIVEGHSGPVAAEVEWQPEKPERPGLWRALYMNSHSATNDKVLAAARAFEAACTAYNEESPGNDVTATRKGYLADHKWGTEFALLEAVREERRVK